MTRDIIWTDGHTSTENRVLFDWQGILAFDANSPTSVTLDFPAFNNVDDAKNYIKNGDWSNALNADALQVAKTITRVYVDNSTPPNLKIVFDVDEPEDSGKTPPGMIWLRFWKTTDYGDMQGATMFKQQGFQFGGNVSYTWGALELMGGGKDLAIETSTHADNSDNVIAYVAERVNHWIHLFQMLKIALCVYVEMVMVMTDIRNQPRIVTVLTKTLVPTCQIF